MDFIISILVPAGVLAAIGFVLGLLISFVAKVFYVEEDPTIIDEVVECITKIQLWCLWASGL